MKAHFIVKTILCLLLWSSAGFSFEEISIDSYLKGVFGKSVPVPKAVWIMGDLKETIKQATNGSTVKLREKYWSDGDNLVLVLEQIGKTELITTAWHLKDNKVVNTKVLMYRESRGGEVANSFFTKLFKGLGLSNDHDLDSHVDGISGATLSVRAMKKMAKQALLLSEHLNK